MPSMFDKEISAKAVRLVKDHVGDYGSEWTAMKAVAARQGRMRRRCAGGYASPRWRTRVRCRVCPPSQRGISVRLKRKCAALERTIEVL